MKLFKQSGEEVKYQGQRDIDSLTAFVTEHTGEVPPSEGATEAEEVEEEEKEVEEIKVDETGLIHLTDSNFQTFISEMSGIHFVKFYAPWFAPALPYLAAKGSHSLIPSTSGVATASVLPRLGMNLQRSSRTRAL